jgi:2-hydroxyacyl-CoA lyase 1
VLEGKATAGQLNKALENRQWFYPKDTSWRAAIAEKPAANAKQIQPMIDDNSTPTNYYRALKDISAWVPKDAVFIGEGANTMDIGRTQAAERRATAASGRR